MILFWIIDILEGKLKLQIFIAKTGKKSDIYVYNVKESSLLLHKEVQLITLSKYFCHWWREIEYSILHLLFAQTESIIALPNGIGFS